MDMRPVLVRALSAFARARREGPWWTIRELIVRSGVWLGWVLLLPATCLGHLLGYRRLPVSTEYIGHLAAEVDCFLKLSRLGEIRQNGRKYFLLAPPDKVANRCLLAYWARSLTVITHPGVCFLLKIMTRGPLMRHDISDYVLAVGCTARYGAVNAMWGGRAPLISLDNAHRKYGEDCLRKMGVPEGAWFVCVHAREGGYFPAGERLHDYRNVNIDTMIPAMKEIVRRGGWCIRVGDPTMKSIPDMDGVIDYVHRPEKSPEMDIFLAASCRFFLGCTSGLFLVSSIFGIPCSLSNMIPLTAALSFFPHDLNIFKLIREVETSRLLTVREIMSSPVAEYRTSYLYSYEGLEPVDNSGDEILDLVIEMLERLEGNFIASSEDEKLKSNFERMLQPGHYGFGSLSQVPTSFLRRHSALLEEQA